MILIDPMGLCGEKNDFFQDVVDLYKNLGWQIITNLLTGGLTGGVPEKLYNPGNFNLQNNPAYFNGMGFSPETASPPSISVTGATPGIAQPGYNAKGNKGPKPGEIEKLKNQESKSNRKLGPSQNESPFNKGPKYPSIDPNDNKTKAGKFLDTLADLLGDIVDL